MHACIVLFKQLSRYVAQLRILLHYSLPDKNKMASSFVPGTDEQTFVLNEAAVSPETKKVTKFCLTFLFCCGIR